MRVVIAAVLKEALNIDNASKDAGGTRRDRRGRVRKREGSSKMYIYLCCEIFLVIPFI